MGHLSRRVDVDKVPFHFMPPAFVERARRPEGEDPDLNRVETVYGFCYQWVFDEKSSANVQQLQHVIVQQAKEAKTSIKMFLLANMLGWQASHPHTKFYPKQLTGEFAINQVRTFAEVCHKKFGVFDTTAMDRLMGSNVAQKDFEAHILNSEIVFGAWIINYKLFHKGNIMTNFYKEKELAVNPYWLAIEPSYYDLILGPHQENPDPELSDLLRRHRWSATKTMAALKKSTPKAIAVFSAREFIMPEAIRFVLAQRGLRAEHFQIEKAPVLDAAKFWSWLGTAIAQHECLKFVYNSPSTFDRHFTRINSVLS